MQIETLDVETGLVARLKAGDDRAFEEMVRAYGGRLLAVARRLLRNDEDARDAVQDAFCSAFRALSGFQENSRLSTWLHRIVVNAALMRMRSRSRRPEESLEDLLPAFDETGHRVTGPTPDGPVEELLRKEDGARVRAAIDRLPDSWRTALLLRDIEEMDTENVAGLLGITPNAVKIRVHRARQALLGILAPAI